MKALIQRLVGWILAPRDQNTVTYPLSSQMESAQPGVGHNFMVCLETGVHKPILRRHIRETLGMSPDQYRAKWNLPPDYPMVSRSYSARRKAAKTAKINK